MTNHFNRLSPPEAERLAILLEEMGEAQHIIGKILRHGFESKDPTDPGANINRSLLEHELGDVKHAIDRLCSAHDISAAAIVHWCDRKSGRATQYLHHQETSVNWDGERD